MKQTITQAAEPLNILVCEYKSYNHAVIRRILERAGHRVTLAGSLAEMMVEFWKQPQAYDLLLVDVIPEENDLLWIREVREARPDIGLLMMSGYLGEGFRPPMFAAYLAKPFTNIALADAVAQFKPNAITVTGLPKAA